ncbi:UNVERIFIED_CONTAM: hypothetical protein RMT77_008928 [Armadillidium vulgare]
MGKATPVAKLVMENCEFEDYERLLPNNSFPEVTYSWRNVDVFSKGMNTFGKKFLSLIRKDKDENLKQILHKVSGICKPGELLAIMGASGAGKTTLLNVLTLRNTRNLKIKGRLFVNGKEANEDLVTNISAYVQQSEMFINSLTVREHLTFQAMLRMDAHFTDEERMLRVEEVISELGLWECSENRIGETGKDKGISGGETKRLSFAAEVITNPPLMFCDEPTSGLDSYMAQNVIGVLKGMAERGKTILTVIHQPSSEVFAMFDRVMIMAEGNVAFFGDVNKALEFFAKNGHTCPLNYNPADFFISTLGVQPGHEDCCSAHIGKLIHGFEESDYYKEALHYIIKNEAPENLSDDNKSLSEAKVIELNKMSKNKYKSPWIRQFKTLLKRSWLEAIRDSMVSIIPFFQLVSVALVSGSLYFGQKYDRSGVKNIVGALYLHLNNISFHNVFAVINIFSSQIPLMLREHLNAMYRTDAYFLAKSVVELPFMLGFPLVAFSIFYFMTGFDPHPFKFLIASIITVLVTHSASSFGYIVACIGRNLDMSLNIAAPLIMPLMLFGGFLLNKKSVPSFLSWVRYISWVNYGNEALNINQWKDTILECDPENSTMACFDNWKSLLTFYNYDENSIEFDLFILVLLVLFYRIVAYFCLLIRTL